MLEVKNKRAKWLADVVVHVNAAFSKDMPCLMYHILVRPGKNEKTPTSGSRRRLEIDLLCCGSLLYPIYMLQFDPGSPGSVIGRKNDDQLARVGLGSIRSALQQHEGISVSDR